MKMMTRTVIKMMKKRRNRRRKRRRRRSLSRKSSRRSKMMIMRRMRMKNPWRKMVIMLMTWMRMMSRKIAGLKTMMMNLW